MVAIFMLTFLPSAAGVGDASFVAVAEVLLRLGLFVGSAIVLGILIVPRLVTYVASLRMGDVLIVVVLGLGLLGRARRLHHGRAHGGEPGLQDG
jgi:CPA2 family monovalent cation:H+ antiporter-2